MTLQLSGTAFHCTGLIGERSLVRLREPDEVPGESASDFALVRTLEDYEVARRQNWQSVWVIGDELNVLLKDSDHRLISVSKQFDYLSHGDVIGIRHPSRRFRILFRKQARHNSFLVTERCNNYCLMCSQPPKDLDDGWILNEIEESLHLVDPELRALTFTGGEPLTDWRGFINLLQVCRDQLSHTAVQVLTNGRAFAASEVVDSWRAVEHPSLIAAIPVYSAVDHIHDYVVQAKGAFDETILGILKLKDRGQRVEVRVVLHALTASSIAETCRWIARNLPFVDHVALMGMENTGFAIANDALLWIDPMDYREVLAQAVEFLRVAGVSTSVYNLPRCVLDRSVWPFAVQSISDWKNGYLDECMSCSEREQCSGLFTSGRPRLSRGIKSIQAS